MNVGDMVEIPFAGGTKEGIIVRLCEKSVWVKVDFPRHAGKLVRRKIHELKGTTSKGSRRSRRTK